MHTDKERQLLLGKCKQMRKHHGCRKLNSLQFSLISIKLANIVSVKMVIYRNGLFENVCLSLSGKKCV